MKKILFITITVASLASCSQEKRLIHKAEVATGRMDYDQAIADYDKVLEKDSNSYRANAGKGMVLSEFTGQYDKAIPYLEKALKESPKDTVMNITYNLGKSYHYIGNYNRALYYYGKLTKYGEVGDPDFDFFLTKRIADCKYALAHPQIAPASEASVVSVGLPINTPMPEYGPVVMGNDLIFTSKRKDDPKEKKNGWDGKYFESMYISDINNGNFSEPRRYTMPDLNGKSEYSKYNEAVVSSTPDGKKMFVYREAKIYEMDVNDSMKSADKLDKTINFAHFKNHAYLTGDGSKLFFTSDSKKGVGGTDIYITEKVNGEWTTPVLLDTGVVNTPFDEDAPYYSENGTLFFSSNGLPGYGGFDVYKTHFENGHWTTPENLGQPINSPGDDIFFTLNGNTSNGYYSSSRVGGYGDMDIYKVHYISTETPDCKTSDDPMLAIDAKPDSLNSLNYQVALQLPQEYSIRSYTWKINDSVLSQTSSQFQYTFSTPGTYTLSVKAVINCDSCPTLLAVCKEKIITVGNEMFVKNDSVTNLNNNDLPNNRNPYITDEQLNAMNWNKSPAYFDYDKSDLREDALTILNQNVEVLKKNTDLTFTISGYADSRGTEEYNKKLSERRANSVKAYLLKNGISKNRIKGTYAFGETMLTNNCSDDVPCTEEQHQKNRRVELKITNVQRPLAVTFYK